MAAGITELVFVTDRSGPALKAPLRALGRARGQDRDRAGRRAARRPRARSSPPRSVWSVVPQGRPLGLGHAVWCAREAVGDAPFAVVLPDDLMVPGCLADLVEVFRSQRAAGVVAVEEVPRHDTARYGIVDVGGAAGPVSPIVSLVEKAGPGGRSLQPRGGREVRVRRLDHGDPRIHPARGGGARSSSPTPSQGSRRPARSMHRNFRGERHDCGSRTGWLRATVTLALAGAPPGDPFPRELESLLEGWRSRAGLDR